MVHWYNGTLLCRYRYYIWYAGNMVQLMIQYGTLEQWYNLTVAHWYTNTMVHWYTGMQVQWYSSTLVQCYNGTPIH